MANERDRKSAVSVVWFFALMGVIFDASKGMLFPEWRPIQTFGAYAYLAFIVSNGLAGATATIFVWYVRDWYTVYPLVVASFLVGGAANCFLEFGVIPITWHFAFGVFAVAAMIFRRVFLTLDAAIEESSASNTAHFKRVREHAGVALKLLVQILIAFTAIFGVAMSIVFGTPETTHLRNFQATGVQTTIGFISCVMALYFWALVPCLRLLERVRS